MIDHSMDRRRFLATCAAGSCALAASSACASLATHQVTSVNGVVALRFADYPGLARSDGAVRVLPDGTREALLVLAQADGQVTVVSTVCTHRGCTVEASGNQLVCPCHGSTYDRSGNVLRGPAERPLRRYATRAVPGGVEILLHQER